MFTTSKALSAALLGTSAATNSIPLIETFAPVTMKLVPQSDSLPDFTTTAMSATSVTALPSASSPTIDTDLLMSNPRLFAGPLYVANSV